MVIRIFAKSNRWKVAISSAFIGIAAVGSSGTLVGQGPAPLPVNPAPAPSTAATSPVAYIYGNTMISQEEFGKYLMDRGGQEKLERFVNKRLIELEAARRNVSVTKIEMEAALSEDLAGIDVKKEEFIKIVLPKYDKTFYEWMEDVIKPRILLSKMCSQRIQITDEDLKIQFERRYGEQRVVQMIMWPKNTNPKSIQEIYGNIRGNADEYTREATQQANPALASSAGRIKPITRHLNADDKIVEETAFKLKKGDVSHILNTHQGYIVMKLEDIIPPNDKVSFEAEKEKLRKAAYDEALTREIPKFFAEIKEKANMQLLYTGPSEWKTVNVTTPPDLLQTGGASAPKATLPSAGK